MLPRRLRTIERSVTPPEQHLRRTVEPSAERDEATLKKKLGVDRKPYLILGACNPPLAHRALQAEPPIGVFLPCNVDIFEGADGAVYVQTPKPTMMFALVGNPNVRPIAEEVEAKLRQVLDSLVG